MVVVAIDKDKGSQGALKWAVERLLSKGKTVTLLHVKLKHPASRNVLYIHFLRMQQQTQKFKRGGESIYPCI